MTRLPEASGSRVLLIGASRFPKAPELPAIPAVPANLDALRRVLTDPATGTIDAEHCVVVSEPADMRDLGPLLNRTMGEATDVLLVYYAGHGLLDDRGHLYLSLTETDPALPRYTALPLDTLREDLAGSPASVRILILDCCFSGRAIEAMADEHGLLAGQLEVSGTYTLTSTTANAPSRAPIGEPYTAFTGALLQAFTDPAPHTLDALYQRTARTLAARGLPRPQRRALNTAGGLALSRGPASAAPVTTADEEVRLKPSESRMARDRLRLALYTGVGAAMPGWLFVRMLSQHPTGLEWLAVALFGLPMLAFLLLLVRIAAPRRGGVPELVVDRTAITFAAGAHTVHVPWKDVAHIGLMRWSHPRGDHTRKAMEKRSMVLAVRLRPGATPPKPRLGLSNAHRELGYSVICTLGNIGSDRDAVLSALERFAGNRLVRTPADFLRVDPRLNRNMV